MHTVKGVWVFNDLMADTPGAALEQYVNFVSNGTSYTRIWCGHGESDSYDMLYDTTCVANVYTQAGTAGYGSGCIPSWEDANYKTVDFGDAEQEVSEDFYEWLVDSAKPINLGYSVTVTAADFADRYVFLNIHFQNGESGYYNYADFPPHSSAPFPHVFSGVRAVEMEDTDDGEGEIYVDGVFYDGGFPPSYTLTGDVEAIVDGKKLYIYTNKKASSAEIIYNGETLSTITDGEAIVLKCNGLKAKSDIIVRAKAGNVKISYNGKEVASISEGQQATLLCGGKKMKSDLEISF